MSFVWNKEWNLKWLNFKRNFRKKRSNLEAWKVEFIGVLVRQFGPILMNYWNKEEEKSDLSFWKILVNHLVSSFATSLLSGSTQALLELNRMVNAVFDTQ